MAAEEANKQLEAAQKVVLGRMVKAQERLLRAPRC